MQHWKTFVAGTGLALAAWAGLAPVAARADGTTDARFNASDPSANAAADGTWNAGFSLGAGFGPAIFGSQSQHHLAAGFLHVGRRLESDKSFLRRLELGGEVWGGGQYDPEAAYVTGLTPMARYHFQPGSRLSPFVDLGLGFVLTDIGLPDLSTTYQFSPQAGTGVHWTLSKHLALTLQARYIHISNAGLEQPNDGVNAFVFTGGLTRFF